MYIIKAYFKCQFVYFFSFDSPHNGAANHNRRVIHFRGAIVESPCDVNTQQQQIELSCMRDGTTRNSLYNQQQLATTSQNVQQIATVKMHYLNEQKNMAILNIEYK